MLMVMGFAGGQPWPFTILIGGPIAIVDVGSGRTAAGTGTPTIHGAGRHSTTGAGAIIQATAGFGSPARFGDRPGSPGVIAALIAAGRHCLRVAATAAASGSPGTVA